MGPPWKSKEAATRTPSVRAPVILLEQSEEGSRLLRRHLRSHERRTPTARIRGTTRSGQYHAFWQGRPRRTGISDDEEEQTPETPATPERKSIVGAENKQDDERIRQHRQRSAAEEATNAEPRTHKQRMKEDAETQEEPRMKSRDAPR